MSDAPEPALPAAALASERPARLHPWSWLFVLVTKLRPFLLPLVLLLFFGTGSTWELWGMAGAVFLGAYALIYSLGFRYHIADGELIVREGVLFRTERHIPLQRVQSVVQRRNLLHRLFGVTELRLESSGGTRPEAVMNVIHAAEADRLERVLRGAAQAVPTVDPAGAATEPRASTLFSLPGGELLRLGLISNRGWVVVGMAIGLYWQFAPAEQSVARIVGHWLGAAFHLWTGNPDQALRGLGLSLVGLACFVVLLKPLSIVMTAVLYHGFRLSRDGGRLSTSCGLLTQRTASARSERIQRLVVAQPMLARLLRRATLCCDVAVQRQEEDGNELTRLHWLAPIGTPERVSHLVCELSPALVLDQRIWRPLHGKAWQRLWKQYCVIAAIAAVVLWFPLRQWAWIPPLVIVTYGWFAARGWAKFAAYSHHDGVLAWRAGWLSREWTTALVRDGHVARLDESPFDRRRGMASVMLDTAGASSSLFPLRIPYLTAAEARALHAALVAEIARRAADPAAIPESHRGDESIP